MGRPWNKGIKTGPQTKEHIEKRVSKYRGKKGIHHWSLSKETKEKMSKNNARYWKGKKRVGFIGKNNPNWKGGISPETKRIKGQIEHKLWRESVFKRDNYTCIWCKKRGCYLEADHVKPFCDYPELRFAIDNGRTLCLDCHSKTDTFKGRIISYRKKYGTRSI